MHVPDTQPHVLVPFTPAISHPFICPSGLEVLTRGTTRPQENGFRQEWLNLGSSILALPSRRSGERGPDAHAPLGPTASLLERSPGKHAA